MSTDVEGLERFARRWVLGLGQKPGLNIMGDIDDVFFPWSDTMHERCGYAGLHDGTKPWKTWHPWLDYGCSKEAWLDVVAQAAIEGVYTTTPPVAEAVSAWNRLHWERPHFNFHLVTARGFMAHDTEIREWTPTWVEEYGIYHDSLTFAKDKVAAQEELGRFDFAIDDGVHNYEALDADGVKVYLLTRPHNADFDAERRVDTVDEFVDLILEESA